MSKFKKIVFIIFLLASLVAAIWAYVSIKKLKSPKVEAITILPDSCNLYLNTNDFKEISSKINAQSLIIDKLKSFDEIKQSCDLLKNFDSVFSNSEILKEELNNKLIHFALYNHCKDWLIAFNTKQTGNDQAVQDQINLVLKQKQKGKEILEYKIEEQVVYGIISNDIISFSNSKLLIQKANKTNTPKFYKSKEYFNFSNALLESNLCNIYFNNKIDKQNKKGLNNYFFDNTELAGNLVMEPSEIKINGNLRVDSNQVLAAFVNEEKQSCESFINLLPNDLIFLEAYGFGSYPNLKKKLVKFYPENNTSFWKEKNEKAMYNLQKEFYENLNGQIVNFETNSIADKLLLASVKDTLKASEQLNVMCDSVLNYHNYKLFKIKQEIAPKLFYPLFTYGLQCGMIKDNHIIFAQNMNQLYQLINGFATNQNIDVNQNFVSYKNENFMSEYNYMIYYSPRMYTNSINNYFNFKSKNVYNPYDNLKHFSYTVVNGKSNFDFRLQLYNQAENKANEQNALWTLNLDTVSNNPSYLFINHNTGENEITIQDEKNNLYLINARGGIIWKRNVEEKIMSPIYLVDIFKNDKFQMLFNTEKYLYLIDRNGKNVIGFPVKLPEKASSALSLLDYNQDKNYRIFIACKNNLIYNFNEAGKLQEGFVPVLTEKAVKLPIQYLKVGNSEYLIALDVEGKIYTFGRKGQTKIALKNKAIQGCKSFYLNSTDVLATSSLIYYDDRNSLINKVNFNDKKDVIKLEIESNLANTSFNLVDDNRESDIIITQDKKIFVYNLNGELLFESKSKLAIDKSMYYSDETNSIYCLLNDSEGALEIIDSRNQKSKSLKAHNLPTIVDLFNDSKIYMIVNFGSQLSCVPFN